METGELGTKGLGLALDNMHFRYLATQFPQPKVEHQSSH